MKTVTNEMLRRELKHMVKTNTPVTISSNTGDNNTNGVTNAETGEAIITVSQKQFKTLTDDCNTLICTDGTKATILQPVPFMKWHCIHTPDNNGIVTLENTLEATILTIDKKHYCLGFPNKYCGVATDLEFLLDLGETELIMNNEYYSIKSKVTVKDGIEK